MRQRRANWKAAGVTDALQTGVAVAAETVKPCRVANVRRGRDVESIRDGKRLPRTCAAPGCAAPPRAGATGISGPNR